VRLALGASRRRLVRQLLVESVVFALAGGVLGVGFAVWTGTLLLRALPSEQAARVLSADPDLRVGAFALLLALLTGLVFGLVPALQATRPQLAPTLKNEAASVAGGTSPFRFRKGLVVAQVALSLLLLIGAGLFTRSLLNLRSLDPGFEADRLLSFAVNPALNGYEPTRRLAVLKRLQDDLAAEPGVKSVSLAEEPLMTNSDTSHSIKVEGYQAREDENMNPKFNGVGPGFFSTLGIPLVAGRDFTDTDLMDAPKVAVVNEEFARYFFGQESPLGRRFAYGRRNAKFDVTIVGLVTEGAHLATYAWRGPLFVSLSILSFAVTIRPLGLVISAFATFLISALGTHETRWKETIIVGIALTAFCSFLFPYGLGLPMQLWPRFLVQ